MTDTTIHPNTPPKLAAKFRRAGSKYHTLADQLQINVNYVYNLIHYGQEPSDRTEKGQAARAALGLSRRRKRPRPPGQPIQPMPEHLKWWSRQDRDNIIRQLFDLNKDRMP